MRIHPSRAAGLVASGLLVAALATDASSIVTPPPAVAGAASPGAQTLVSVPPIEYPNGYHVTVQRGQVVSAPNAPMLTVVADAGADTVDVAVTP